MGVKAVGAVRWLLLLLIAVAIACDYEPAPTSTPPPASTPMAMPEPTSIPTPTYGPEACNLMDTPYDALMTSTTPFGETRAEIRYSEGYEHIVMTTTDHESVLFGKGEMIIKDGTRYSRESTPGNPEVYGEWRVHGTNVPRSLSLPCLDPGSFEWGASGSSDEPHFTSERFLSEEEGAVRNEYWTDSTGRPTRARRTIFPPEYDGVSNTETIAIDFTYTDYGEPNTIAAPCASAAPDQADNPALMRDCIALLAAKDTLRGTGTLNWSVDTAITSWDGITTGGTPSRVTEIALSNRLIGNIPWELGDLSGLLLLSLNYNQLTGTIPATLGNLVNLRHLSLVGNQLSGEIPAELGNLNGLQTLYLDDNQLSGEIPEELGNLSSLRQLFLLDNELTEEIPTELGDLANLDGLYLSGNSFTGCIPPALRDVDENDLDRLDLPNCAPNDGA